MSLAIFGGTFDPVHIGHLRSAVEIKETLGVDRVKLIPAFLPPHRNSTSSDSFHRLNMLKLGVQHGDGLEVDDIEYQLKGKSFTINTLKALREREGVTVPFVLVLGADAFVEFHTWHEWRRVLEYCHIVVVDRPGHKMDLVPDLAAWHASHQIETSALLESANGGIGHLTLTQLDISATKIRALISQDKRIDFLVPAAVQEYILKHGLYKTGAESADGVQEP